MHAFLSSAHFFLFFFFFFFFFFFLIKFIKNTLNTFWVSNSLGPNRATHNVWLDLAHIFLRGGPWRSGRASESRGSAG